MSERDRTGDQNDELRPSETERCLICGSRRVHVYPPDESADTMAVCLKCGAHYHAGIGWIDPEDL